MSESRRSLLKRGLLFAGGLVGVGTMGAFDRAPSTPAGTPAGNAMVLHGRDWHVQSRELAAGQLPEVGQRMLVSGALFPRPDAEAPIGEFAGTYISMNAGQRFGALASLEHHVITLPDGAIMGLGRTGDGLDSEDEFAIVGGTGRYVGARGSYLIRQGHSELGGDGTATITLSLQTEAL